MNQEENLVAESVFGAAQNEMSDIAVAPKPKKKCGFAIMDHDRVVEIAAKGGVVAHARGTAHKWNRTEAQAAGRLGGVACHIAIKARKNANNEVK